LLALLEPITGRASDAAAHCLWLSNRHAQFQSHSCEKAIWLRASGSEHWRLTLDHPLKPGRYEVLAEALGKGGLSADTLAPGTGDVRTFTVH
jgi:hypothetical protein